MTNLYKAAYNKQHPERDIAKLVLKIIALLIAIAIVSTVSRLDSEAEEVITAAEPTEVEKATNSYKIQHEYSNISISDEEYIELCQIVAAESQTQSLEGQKAVVEVIFNRVLSKDFPDTVHGVLSQKGQFATWKLRSDKWVEPQRAVEAIAFVVTNGRTVLPSTKYVYFDTKGRNGRKHIKIGSHYFGAGK